EGKELLKFADGSVHQTIYFPEVKAFHIALPPLTEQKRIAEVLSAFDDKIELNRRMNETLERMAQAIFRDWFVDFGPVRRKMEGASDPVKIMGGVTTNADEAARLAALFPAALADDGLPEGWEDAALSDFVELNPKEPLKKGTVAPYTDMAALPTSGPTTAPPVSREFNSGMRFRNGDALLARITPCLENGKSAYVDFLPDDESVGWGSTEFIVLRSKPPVPSPFAYLMVRHPEFRERAVQSMTGTSGRQRAQANALARFPIARAKPNIYASFGEIIQPMFDLVSAHAKESRTLAAMRDLLLPKLMSGEIRLKDTKKIAEAAE
ncbi:MAG: restriction endonuclease subunit S, partial [Parvularculaceae bacterium]